MDTSAMEAFREMREAFKDLGTNSKLTNAERKQERKQAAEAFIGIMAAIVIILLSCFFYVINQ